MHTGSEASWRVEARLLSSYQPRARQLRREHDPKARFPVPAPGRRAENKQPSQRIPALRSLSASSRNPAVPSPSQSCPRGRPGRLECLASHTLWPGPESNQLGASLRGPWAACVYGRHTPFVGSQGPSAPKPGRGSSVLCQPLGCSRPGHPLKLKTGLGGSDALGNRTQPWRAQGNGGSRRQSTGILHRRPHASQGRLPKTMRLRRGRGGVTGGGTMTQCL